MKKFEFPEIKIIELMIEDIVNASLNEDDLGDWT